MSFSTAFGRKLNLSIPLKVHAVMRDASDESKTSWMKQIPNATADNLKFFSGHLDKKGSFGEAIKGCDGVVVCAFPESPR